MAHTGDTQELREMLMLLTEDRWRADDVDTETSKTSAPSDNSDSDMENVFVVDDRRRGRSSARAKATKRAGGHGATKTQQATSVGKRPERDQAQQRQGKEKAKQRRKFPIKRAEETIPAREKNAVSLSCALAFVFWWSSPAATACWQSVFAVLQNYSTNFGSEQMIARILRKQYKTLRESVPADDASGGSGSIAHELHGRRALHKEGARTSRAVVLLSLPGVAPSVRGLEKYTDNALRDALKPNSARGAMRLVPAYSARTAQGQICLVPGYHCRGPSSEAGIIRPEIAASLKAVVSTIRPSPLPLAGMSLSLLQLQHIRVLAWSACLGSWPSHGRELSQSVHELLHYLDNQKSNPQSSWPAAAGELLSWIHVHVCDAAAAEQPLPPSAWDTPWTRPLATIAKGPLGASLVTAKTTGISNKDAKSFFLQLWAFLAREGDVVSSLLDLVFHIFDTPSLWRACQKTARRQHQVSSSHNATHSGSPMFLDFEAVTSLCYSIEPSHGSFTAAVAAASEVGTTMHLVVGTDGTCAELLSALEGSGILRSAKIAPDSYMRLRTHWSKALLVALELASHGFISSSGRPLPEEGVTTILSIPFSVTGHHDIGQHVRHGIASLQRMLTNPASAAAALPSIQWYIEPQATRAAKRHLAKAANCEAVWKTACMVPGADDAATAVVALALFTSASGSVELREDGLPAGAATTPGSDEAIPGGLALNFLLLASTAPGALLILLNCLLCLPLLTCSAVLSQVRHVGLAASTPLLDEAISHQESLPQAVGVARALVGRGVFPDVSAGVAVTPLDLWLQSQRALRRLRWLLPRQSLRPLLEEAGGAMASASPVVYTGQESLLPPSDLSAASFLEPLRLGEAQPTLYVRPDPWALWLGLQ